MRDVMTFLLATLVLLCALILGSQTNKAYAQSMLSPGYAETDAGYTPSERAGREIWFFATAFNDRFFTYTYPQRLGATIDWYEVLGAENKGDLFPAWGAIVDPDCCIPGDADCPAQSLDETYGFQWCPGDEDLLSFVGKDGYRDPACDFNDAPFNTATPHGEEDQRQDACDLRYGTSTGALGLRKFPNPRFDPEKWVALNGSLSSWDGYRKMLSDADPADADSENADARMNRLFDGSVEPPFRIGMACGACHIAFKPTNPPDDPNDPQWEHIDGLVGNQYSRVSNMLGNGLSKHRLEWQLIARSRPGVVDTSALPMDLVSNPGTMNAIINIDKRPAHEHRLSRWEKVSTCPAGAEPEDCWCEPGKPGKCWEWQTATHMVPHILKGGEDSVGLPEAIQRVYFNIGSCAEQCWINHVPDLRAADPAQRNYGQTPFDIGQCRRDCASFRAIEDRLGDIQAFFQTARPSDLWEARGLASPRDLELELEEEYFEGAVEQGREIFAQTCARCHSSQPGPYGNTDFLAASAEDATLREDWLGNDLLTPVSEVGTYNARAMHSNHMQSRVWEQYGSETLRARAPDAERTEVMKGGGRGYYRNISLLSAWAHAPFMQNNAIGPELCGKNDGSKTDHYSPTYVDENGALLEDPPACWLYDTSVEGRYELYKASMDAMLNPDKRIDKMFILDRDIIIDVAPKVELGPIETGLSLKILAGQPAVALASLRYKDLLQDLILRHRNPEKLAAKYDGILDGDQFTELSDSLDSMLADLIAEEGHKVVEIISQPDHFIQRYYSNVHDRIENIGHDFGEDLTDEEKQALTAFVATL